MEKHFELSDYDFESQFISCQLDPEVFSHEAHLRLAWINITQYGMKQAESNVRDQLLNFVQSVGAKDKYNETLTLAAIKAVNHFILKSRSNNFKDFIIEFPRLKHSFKELMSCHYGIDIYTSQRAKSEYIHPDLLPFD